ncbi:MAG: OsmC family protein [Phycisphaeraceae bacterium]|nr:OsmC family protein [Phycisphaeraceae bacterium]
MPTIKRTAQAQWNGSIKDGAGTLSAPGGALKNTPYSFASRFESANGTNPEELIAAAHAGCFTMALSFIMSNNGITPTKLATNATLSMEQVGGGWQIAAIHLDVTGTVPGIDSAKFEQLANEAKTNCPVSKVLNTKITMEANLS